MKAIIMAGGFGTRLRPLTLGVPKPMVPMCNKPMMEHVVNLLKKHGFDHILSLLYFQPEAITDYFGDGKDFGVKMEYKLAEDDFGTAGSVRNAYEDFFEGERILIISGDVLTDFDLSSVIEFHEKRQADASMVLTQMENPLSYGVVITDNDDKIVRFLEKPTWGEVFSDKINTGIYVLEPGVTEQIPNKTFYDFSGDLFPKMLSEKQKLYGCNIHGYWRDVGNISEYVSAHQDILKGEVSIDVGYNILKHEKSILWIGKNIQVDDSVKYENVVALGDNVTIEPDAEISNTVIGDNCIIGAKSKISNSVIWHDTVVSEQAEINQALILNDCRLGAKVHIDENAIISESVQIGDEVDIRPNVKVWPKKEIENGAVVSTSLVWGEKWNRELFTDAKVTGLGNLELTPEFAAKLGAAYGAMLGPGSSVILSRDVSHSSRMLQRAFGAGLISAGVNVKDLQTLPIPVVRFELSTGRHSGGTHFRQTPYKAKMQDMIFFGDDGLDLPTSKTKSLERLFLREDFRRADIDEVGRIEFPVRVLEAYRENFIKALDVDTIRKHNFKVVIDYSNGGAVDIFPALFGELGCEVISLNAYIDPSRATMSKEEKQMSLNTLSVIVKSLNANIGIMLDNNAEKVRVIDREGEEVSDQLMLLMMTDMFLATNQAHKIAVPMVASMAVEEIASQYGVEVVRVRNDHHAMMDAKSRINVDFVGGTRGGFIFPGFQLGADAMFAAVKFLELIARSGHRPAELRKKFKDLIMLSEDVPCHWRKKGQVMRNLIEQTVDEDRQLVDGVRILRNGSWVLVAPDREKDLFHIHAEARDKNRARSLLDEFKNKISEMQK
ncbi:MAG: NTP transferase domain-containing protein [candidate division Zixibacteria bacterium]|nr:NTP transferase domain-containing protein [candidate division Zixibacteria bacterium]